MLKYKVGQRVKVVKGGSKNMEVTIVDTQDVAEFPYLVEFNDGGQIWYREESLSPLPKTLDTLVEGDVLNNALGLEFVVLGVCGQAVFCQKAGEYVITRSISDLKSDGWTVKQDEPEEYTEEVTIAQLERERGHKVKIVEG